MNMLDGIGTTLHDIFTSLDATLTFLIISGLVLLFSMQIFAWVTPPKPKFLHAVGLGAVGMAFVLFGIYNYLPLAPSLVRASINGVYDNFGYLWVGSLVILNMVFLMNTIQSWKDNKPLEVFQ